MGEEVIKNPFFATILVVDDTPQNLLILTHSLRGEYNVVTADSGVNALVYLEHNPLPLIILLDVVMPEMDGYEVCRRIKENKKTENIPIIFITALTSDEDEIHGLMLGAVDYITKPFNLTVVRARIKTQIELRQKLMLLDNLSMIDPVLLVPNNRYFEYYLQKQWIRSRSTDECIGVSFFGLDYESALAPEDRVRQWKHFFECVRRVSFHPGTVVAKYKENILALIIPSEHDTVVVALVEGIAAYLSTLAPRDCLAPMEGARFHISLAIAKSRAQSFPNDVVDKAAELLRVAQAGGRNAVVWEMIEP